jgi:pimeloyl-ACP methyl ester carboxylesterase
MPNVDVNGTTLWYEFRGEGEYLLQIGGAGFAHENFGFVTEEMAKHFKVIEFDLRGYGLSARPVQVYSMEEWADDIAALFDAIGVEKAHVHGTSMGGIVAIALAHRHPDKIDKLILDCPVAKGDDTANHNMDVWKALAEAYGMGGKPLAQLIATQCLSRGFLDTPQGGETVKVIAEVLERNCSVEVFTAACDAIKAMDLREALPKITAETLVMVGDQDILTPLDQGPKGAGGRYIAEHIPGAELYIIEGSGHTNLMEEPELSSRVVIDFLQGRLNQSAAA